MLFKSSFLICNSCFGFTYEDSLLCMANSIFIGHLFSPFVKHVDDKRPFSGHGGRVSPCIATALVEHYLSDLCSDVYPAPGVEA